MNVGLAEPRGLKRGSVGEAGEADKAAREAVRALAAAGGGEACRRWLDRSVVALP